MKTLTLIPIMVIVALLLNSCKKQNDFLNAKPNQALAIPTTLEDMYLLVNNQNVFNRYYPGLGEASTDDIVMDNSLWLNDFDEDRKAYIWAQEISTPNEKNSDWSSPYNMVYYANTILTYLPAIKITANQQTEYNLVEGSALFFRAMAFYNLVEHFAMPYDSTSATTDLGVPLPLKPDLTAKVGRSTESQCYDQIIADLNSSVNLLPDVPASITLPSKAAVYGLFARIYLIMGKYGQSLNYATKSLALYSQLQDFNKLDPNAFPVYPNFSPEEMFHASLIGGESTSFQVQVDSNLYQTFNDVNDLRPSIFFYYADAPKIEFNSQFDRNNAVSIPISTNEIYLTKAECEARLNNTAAAMADLNTLLVTRWKTGTFKPYNASSADDALKQILMERRKELVLTSLRWTDLRRLNKDSRFALTLYRSINGMSYSLPPNDPRYTFPIPDIEIKLNPMPQNPR